MPPPGATGLIGTLANDFLSTCPQPEERSITWVCNHSRNTQLALLYNYIDVALTYERSTEVLAASEGWSLTAGCVFHDHFVLAGPESDPAGIRSCSSLSAALGKIAERGTAGNRNGKGVVLWHARNDDSATMWKERSLWSMAESSGDGNGRALKPWEDEKACGEWYQMHICSPAEAIRNADAAGAYLLTDRSTLLRQTALQTISSTTVFFEPSSEDDVLMNSCFALSSPARNSANERAFLEYLASERGQGVVGAFGEDMVGVPFFARVEEGFARRKLRGGVPRGGRWVVDCGL